MAILKQGILGGFSGKVGPVVGFTWRGKQVIRAKATSVRNPRTPAQLEQRAKFTLVGRFVRANTPYLRVGFAGSGGISPVNAAMSRTIREAVTGAYPNFTLDWGKVRVAQGALEPAGGPSVTLSGSKFTFDIKSTTTGNGLPTDRMMPLLYNETKGESIYNVAGEARSVGSDSLSAPSEWKGDKVHAYLAMATQEGDTVSNSVYLGEHIVS